MIHFITEQLAGRDVCEYSVSVSALDAWAKIVTQGVDGTNGATVIASWNGEALDVRSVEGDGDRLFGESTQGYIEIAIREAYAELPGCGDSGHPTACGCDEPRVFAATAELAAFVLVSMADMTEPWTLLQAAETAAAGETVTIEDRERVRGAIDLLVRSGRVWPVRVSGHPRFRVAE